jgi:hypothetical protein
MASDGRSDSIRGKTVHANTHGLKRANRRYPLAFFFDFGELMLWNRELDQNVVNFVGPVAVHDAMAGFVLEDPAKHDDKRLG